MILRYPHVLDAASWADGITTLLRRSSGFAMIHDLRVSDLGRINLGQIITDAKFVAERCKVCCVAFVFKLDNFVMQASADMLLLLSPVKPARIFDSEDAARMWCEQRCAESDLQVGTIPPRDSKAVAGQQQPSWLDAMLPTANSAQRVMSFNTLCTLVG